MYIRRKYLNSAENQATKNEHLLRRERIQSTVAYKTPVLGEIKRNASTKHRSRRVSWRIRYRQRFPGVFSRQCLRRRDQHTQSTLAFKHTKRTLHRRSTSVAQSTRQGKTVITGTHIMPDELFPGSNVLLDHPQPAFDRVPSRNRVAVAGQVDLPKERQTTQTNPQPERNLLRNTRAPKTQLCILGSRHLGGE